jgi:hypothetical protein
MARVFSVSRNEDQSLALRVTTPEFEQNKAMICSASAPAPSIERSVGLDAPTLNMT